VDGAHRAAATTSESGGGVRTLLFFVLRFTFIAPLCLVAGWTFAPEYAWLVGQFAGLNLIVFFDVPIESLRVEAAGILNSRSNLYFGVDGTERGFPFISLVTGLPSFVALVLSTGNLTLKRRLVVLFSGSGILFLAHGIYVVIVFVYGSFLQQWPQIPEMLITLPFLLWILLVYWREIAVYFSEEPPEKNAV